MARMGTNEPANRPVGSDELREALTVVHEGLLNVVRFQLAIERKDRRVAMQTMDDVVVIEQRLADLIVRSAPDADGGHSHAFEFRRQRSALAREKLTLAAGRSEALNERDAIGSPQAQQSFDRALPASLPSIGMAESTRCQDGSRNAPGTRTEGYKLSARARISGGIALLLLVAAVAGGVLLNVERIGEMVSFLQGWEAKHGR